MESRDFSEGFAAVKKKDGNGAEGSEAPTLIGFRRRQKRQLRMKHYINYIKIIKILR